MDAPFSLNPFDPEFVRDPFAVYARGRAEQPVFRHQGLPLLSAFRYADVEGVLRDAANWSSRFPPPPNAKEVGFPEAEDASMLGQDQPRHTRLRNLVNQAFTPRMIRALEPRLREVARELLDEALEKRSVDIVDALSHPLPVIAIAEMIGVPVADRAQFREWSDLSVENLGEGIGGMPIDPERARVQVRVAAEMDAYFWEQAEQRRRRPQEDLLTGLVNARIDGRGLGRTELMAMLQLLLVAGNETTTNLIGNAVLQFLAHPDELRRLRVEPALLPTAIEEVLRFDSPVQATVRRAARDLEVGGVPVQKEESVLLWLGSANRDAEFFPEPDRFDVARTPNRHLSFGFGIHFCLGANLARLEARVALGGLLERTRGFARSEPGDPVRSSGFILRGPKRLSLELDPA